MELERYIRQIVLPEVGFQGQERLRRSSVLIIGLGGLGSPLAYYLAAAGVGRLGLVEFDRVELANLHRQILYSTPDVGRSKLAAASERLRALNPEVELRLYEEPLGPENALRLLEGFDVVADGSDNFPTRYAASDACVRLGLPYVYGSVYRLEGQVGVLAGGGACYRCLYPQPPNPDQVPSCATAGLLGPMTGLIGSFQALEVLKILLGLGRPLRGRVLHVDGLRGEVRVFSVEPDPRCPVCAGLEGPALTTGRCTLSAPALEPEVLWARLSRGDVCVFLDVRDALERATGHLGGLWIPLVELNGRIQELAPYRDQELIVYCEEGQRSARAVEWLRQCGFSRTYSLAGGLRRWRQRGLPLQGG